MNSRSWITRSSLGLSLQRMVPISSKKIVPRLAVSKIAFTRSATAPVKAPLTWPEERDSSRSGGTDPECTGTKGCSARTEYAWMAFAISSLPVPGFPGDQDGGARAATWPTQVRILSMPLALADDVRKTVALRRARLSSVFSRSRRRFEIMRSDLDQQLLVIQGLEK